MSAKKKTTNPALYIKYVQDVRPVVFESEQLRIVTKGKKGCEMQSDFFHFVNNSWQKFATAYSKVTAEMIAYAQEEFKVFNIKL